LFPTVAGYSGNGVGLLTTGASYGPNVSSQMSSVWIGAANAYAGWSASSNQPVLGQDSWYHVRMKLPSGAYQPTTGQWNWMIGWHNDGHTAPTGAGPYSIDFGIYTDYPVVSGAVGQNPHFALRLAGGDSANPTYQTVELPARISYDHWYDITFHFVWHTSSSIGLAEWYLDGQQMLSEHFPTLYHNPDGTQSYNAFGVYNYHLAAPWDSRVDFDDIAIGPTRTSVGG
jgi:hypothetical protein